MLPSFGLVDMYIYILVLLVGKGTYMCKILVGRNRNIETKERYLDEVWEGNLLREREKGEEFILGKAKELSVSHVNLS